MYQKEPDESKRKEQQKRCSWLGGSSFLYIKKYKRVSVGIPKTPNGLRIIDQTPLLVKRLLRIRQSHPAEPGRGISELRRTSPPHWADLLGPAATCEASGVGGSKDTFHVFQPQKRDSKDIRSPPGRRHPVKKQRLEHAGQAACQLWVDEGTGAEGQVAAQPCYAVINGFGLAT